MGWFSQALAAQPVPQFGRGVGKAPTAVANVWIFCVVWIGPGVAQRRDHAPRLFNINDIVAGTMKAPTWQVLDGSDAIRIATTANGHDSRPLMRIACRQAPYAEASPRCAAQVNALLVHRIFPDDLLQDGHSTLAVGRISFPETRFGLWEEDEHIKRLFLFLDKRP